MTAAAAELKPGKKTIGGKQVPVLRGARLALESGTRREGEQGKIPF
jgi:hypothetical protein